MFVKTLLHKIFSMSFAELNEVITITSRSASNESSRTKEAMLEAKLFVSITALSLEKN